MAKQAVRRELTRSDYAKRGLIALVVVALALGLVYLKSQGTLGGPEHVSARVADAGGSLSNGADVKIRGVIVGKVSGVSSDGTNGVRIGVDIDKDRLAVVPSNVVARILPATVFGTTYLDLTTHGTRSAKALRPGAVIPADQTQGTLELQQALDDIDSLVKAVGPAELASAIGSAAQALDGRGTQIGKITDRVDSYLARLNPKMPLLRQDVRKLAASLQVVDQVAPDLLAATNDSLVAARTVVTQKAQIARLLSGGTALAADSARFVGDNERDLVRFLHNSVALLDAVYDNRHAGITQAFATNRMLNTKLNGILDHGFVDTLVKIDLNVPSPYTAADCPRFGAARGDNCSGLARAGVGAMFEGGDQ